MTTVSGRTWVFGDGIDTDIIIPARYLVLPIDEMKGMAMEPVIDLSMKPQAKVQVELVARNERQRRDSSVPAVGVYCFGRLT